MTGAAFDRAYMNDMVKDHQTAIRDFQAASKIADADVKSFAEKTLPTLQHHLEEAQRIVTRWGPSAVRAECPGLRVLCVQR